MHKMKSLILVSGILFLACADENPSAAEPQSQQSEFWARTAKITTIGDDQEVVQDSIANPLYVINFRTADTLDAYYRDTLSNCVFLADYEYWRNGDYLSVYAVTPYDLRDAADHVKNSAYGIIAQLAKITRKPFSRNTRI